MKIANCTESVMSQKQKATGVSVGEAIPIYTHCSPLRFIAVILMAKGLKQFFAQKLFICNL